MYLPRQCLAITHRGRRLGNPAMRFGQAAAQRTGIVVGGDTEHFGCEQSTNCQGVFRLEHAGGGVGHDRGLVSAEVQKCKRRGYSSILVSLRAWYKQKQRLKGPLITARDGQFHLGRFCSPRALRPGQGAAGAQRPAPVLIHFEQKLAKSAKPEEKCRSTPQRQRPYCSPFFFISSLPA